MDSTLDLSVILVRSTETTGGYYIEAFRNEILMYAVSPATQ